MQFCGEDWDDRDLPDFERGHDIHERAPAGRRESEYWVWDKPEGRLMRLLVVV